jgi:hypothetical protein
VRISYDAVTPYLVRFLTAPHPFRNGVICPFMPRALTAGNIHFSYFDSKESDHQLHDLINECTEFYKAKTSISPGAVIILFEAEFDVLRLLRAHINTKINCIEKELMIGALYKDSQAPSLHSSDYFPLRTPIPTLVIRDLTAQDLQFLHPPHYTTYSKIKFLNSYIRKFSTANTKGYVKTKVEEAIFLRKRYKLKLMLWSMGFIIVIISISRYFLTNWWMK